MEHTIIRRSLRWLKQHLLPPPICYPPLLGLDINHTTFRLVELSRQGGQLALSRYRIEAFATGTANHHALPDIDTIATALRQTWQRLGSESRDVAIAIPSSMAYHKILHITAPDSSSLEEQVREELGHLITSDLSEVSFDFQVIDNKEKTHELNVLVCAARRDTVEERVATVELAGLNVRVVDVECFASLTALAYTPFAAQLANADQAAALFNISATTLQCHIIRGNNIIYYRNQIIDNTRIETLSLETQRALQSFHNTVSLSHPQHISHILLAGNALPDNADATITDYTGIATHTVNPLINISSTLGVPRIDATSLLVACGLALRRFDL